MELRDQDTTNSFFKAITVERTNSLDIHKVSQRLTQYRLSTQKKQKTLDIHPPQPLILPKNKLYYSVTTKKPTNPMNQTV